MNAPTDAHEALRAGDPAAALDALQQQVRSDAANPKLRIFLFQLLAITGQWQRALTQLQLCGELDASTLAMVQTYRDAIQCEALRESVFAGKTTPQVIGPPRSLRSLPPEGAGPPSERPSGGPVPPRSLRSLPPDGAGTPSERPGGGPGRPDAWVALMIQALAADAQGDGAGAFALRAQAMDDAPARPGRIGDRGFEWVADADSRLGPILEVIVSGRYAWLPIDGIAKLEVEAPSDLRDLVWLPANLHFTNGGGTVALIPARYPGTTASADGSLLMGRRTEWLDMGHDQYRGLGQKLLATDQDEIGLFDVREIVFDDEDDGPRTMASEI
jgi:type VI secretion system protein ImpE